MRSISAGAAALYLDCVDDFSLPISNLRRRLHKRTLSRRVYYEWAHSDDRLVDG